jgi:hypothetical protein
VIDLREQGKYHSQRGNQQMHQKVSDDELQTLDGRKLQPKLGQGFDDQNQGLDGILGIEELTDKKIKKVKEICNRSEKNQKTE